MILGLRDCVIIVLTLKGWMNGRLAGQCIGVLARAILYLKGGNMELHVLEREIQEYAMVVVKAKLERLKARRFVLFPWLRARRLLKLVRHIKKG